MWWWMIACVGPEPEPTPGGEPELCSWGQVSAAPSSSDALAAVLTVTPSVAGSAAITWVAADRSGSAPDLALSPDTPASIAVRDLPVDTDVTVTTTVHGESCATTLRLPPLPQGWPTPIVEVDLGAPLTGMWCLDTPFVEPVETGIEDLRNVWTCTDRTGRVVRSLENPDSDALPMVRPLTGGRLAGVALPGQLHTFDALDEPLSQWTPDELDTRFVHDALDRHEVLELVEGPWAGALAVLTTTKELIDGVDTQANGIIVLDPDTGEVLWDWSLHGDAGDAETVDPDMLPYDRVGLAGAPSTDWAHANALLHGVEPDGRQFFWVSLRSHDWIVRVDVDSGTIDWRLGWQGDFVLLDEQGQPLPDDAWFFHQHAPTWVDGDRSRVMLFDNGNVRPDDDEIRDAPQHSRAVELRIDEPARTATLTWAWGPDDPDHPDHFFSRNQGSAAPLPDGAVGILTEEAEPVLVEVDRDGVVRWRARWPGLTPAYRALWVETLYP